MTTPAERRLTRLARSLGLGCDASLDHAAWYPRWGIGLVETASGMQYASEASGSYGCLLGHSEREAAAELRRIAAGGAR